jgi:glycosyl hydrolase family 123/concanavalin A-like lectin/glucanase superfamily protein
MKLCFLSPKKLSSLFFTASLISLIGCVSNIQEKIKEKHIVAHWDFNNVDGNKLIDKAGGNDAVIHGDAKGVIKPGLYGNSTFFDTGKIYATVKHSKMISLEDKFSIEMVIKPFKIKNFNTIIWKGDRTILPEVINFYVDIRDGKIELKTKDKKGKWCVFGTRKPVLKTDKWYHILITYDGGIAKIFINGKKETSEQSETRKKFGKLLANPYPIMIGSGANRRERMYHFKGLIDYIKIYDGVIAGIDADSQFEWAKRNYDFQMKKTGELQSSINKKLRDLGQISKNTSKTLAFSSSNPDELSSFSKDLQKLNQFQLEFLKNVSSMKAPILYRQYFKKFAKPGAKFAVATLLSCKRLNKESEFYKKLGVPSNEINLTAAKNEREGFQVLVLGNPDSDTDKISIKINGLTHENGSDKIAREKITYGWIKSIKTEEPNIAVDFIGEIPDAIIEDGKKINVTRNDFTPVFIRIHVDKETKPGKYSGTVEFAKNGQTEKVFVKLNVYDFTLPLANSIKFTFPFWESFYKKWYGIKELTHKQQMYICRWLLDYRISPNNNYTREPCFPSIELMKKLKPLGANYLSLKYVGGSKPWTEKQIEKRIDSYRTTIDKLKENGFFKDTYLKSFDEIDVNMQKIKVARQIMPRIRKAFPDLKCRQASFPNPLIEDLFNVWCPLFSYFGQEKYRKKLNELMNKPGVEVFWYAADRPEHPYPNFFLDYPVFDCRIISTLTFKYKVKGLHYWAINREWVNNNKKGEKWPEISWDPYIFSAHGGARKYKNGMGNFTYPGPNGQIYPSLRLENLRDGIEDFEYLKLLERRTAQLKAKDGESDLVKDAEILLKIPTDVAVAVDKYSSAPEHLLNYRTKVAEMIEKVSAHLKK